ncbi:60S ribosomal protein L32, partial [Trichonephila clavata]
LVVNFNVHVLRVNLLHVTGIMSPLPLNHCKIVKKRVKKFTRHQSDRYGKIKLNWRKPKVLIIEYVDDLRVSVRCLKLVMEVVKKTKHLLLMVSEKFNVRNIKELECLMMCNRRFCAEINHAVSSKKRKAIVERAQQLCIRVINANADCVLKKMNKLNQYFVIVAFVSCFFKCWETISF